MTEEFEDKPWSLWDIHYHYFGDNAFRDDEQYNTAEHTIIKTETIKANALTVLDCGCATCIDYEYLKNTGIKYTGFDITKKFLDAAKKHNPEVNCLYADIRNIPFADNSFDVVYCKDVLEHVAPEDCRIAFEEMWRIANSKVIISFHIAPIYGQEELIITTEGFHENHYNEQDILKFVFEQKWKELRVLKKVGYLKSSIYIISKEKHS